MAINNKAQAKNREELLAKGLFNNGQKPSSLKETKKTSPSQSSVRPTDILSKAPEIPPVANLSVPTKQLNEKPPEIKPQTSQQATTPLTFLSKPPNSSGQPTNPSPQGSTSSLAQIKNAPPPVTTTLHSQNANPLGGSGNTGPKNTGIVFIGIKSSPA
jgi:hypothetical protein